DLREMGTVALLTRDGEVVIAKCIERGHRTVLKSLSRSPVIVREIISRGDQLKKDPSIIKNILRFRDEELTDDKIDQKLQESLSFIDEIGKPNKRLIPLGMKWDGLGWRGKKASVRGDLWNVGRRGAGWQRPIGFTEFQDG